MTDPRTPTDPRAPAPADPDPKAPWRRWCHLAVAALLLAGAPGVGRVHAQSAPPAPSAPPSPSTVLPSPGPTPAAPPPGAAGPAGDRTATLQYTLSLGPLPVFDVEATLRLGPAAWSLGADVVPRAAFRGAYDFTLTAAADGPAEAGVPIPQRYRMRAATPRDTQETTIATTRPRGRAVQPVRTEPPVRASDLAPEVLAGALDPLAAIAQTLMAVAKDGRCPARLTVYDGWRLFTVRLDTGGREVPPMPPGGGVSIGPAQTCAFAVDQGPRQPQQGDYLQYFTRGTLWIADGLAGSAPVVVRVEAGQGIGRAILALRSLQVGG